jgi:translation elongation factor P/translation initiation factor 5A
VPADVIEIVPEYREFDYIMLDDNRIAIIDRNTYEVVDIIVLA